MGLNIIFNTVCVVYDKRTRMPSGLLHSVFAGDNGELLFLVYRDGLTAHAKAIPNGMLADSNGSWLDPADVARGRAIPKYENLSLDTVRALAPPFEAVRSALGRPGVVFMVPPGTRSTVKYLLDDAKWLSCMLEPFDLPDLLQHEFSERVCARGHTFNLSERLSECYVRGSDHITCGTLGCDQTIPVRVFETVKSSLSPAIQSLVESVGAQSHGSPSALPAAV